MIVCQPGVITDRNGLRTLVANIRLVAFDFDGVFTDNLVYVLEDGSEAVRCSRGDGFGLRKLEKLRIKPIIISTENNPVVSQRSRKLKIDCVQSCEDKPGTLKSITGDMGIGLDQVAYMGNDINDSACLACVGFPIVVRDAHPDVLGYARFQTAAMGGRGAVREVCDLIERLLSGDQEPPSQ